MKKIAYIITDLYPPAFAPRIFAFSKYLQEYDIEPIVFTERQKDHLLFGNYEDPCRVFRFSLKSDNSIIRNSQRLLEIALQYKEQKFTKNILTMIDACDLPKPDVVLSFCYRKFPITSARKISEIYSVPLIADCRDIIEQYRDFLPNDIKFLGVNLRAMQSVLRGLFIGQRNKSLEKANVVTTVSHWHQKLLQTFTNSPVEVVYNGYDPEVFIPNNSQINANFDIVFTGRLISKHLRDPSLLLKAVRELTGECPLLRLHFYTDDISAKVIYEANKNISCPVDIYPMVDHKKIPEVLNNASMIALISNPASQGGAKGMISTKIFEAMAMCRPIILLPDTDSEAADILRKSTRGVATNDIAELKQFIRGCYQKWQDTNLSIADGNEAFVSQFDRSKQAKTMADIIQRVL